MSFEKRVSLPNVNSQDSKNVSQLRGSLPEFNDSDSNKEGSSLDFGYNNNNSAPTKILLSSVKKMTSSPSTRRAMRSPSDDSGASHTSLNRSPRLFDDNSAGEITFSMDSESSSYSRASSIPPLISKLTSLEEEIILFSGRASSAEKKIVFSNRFLFSITPNLWRCANLEILDLSHNQISVISENIAQLQKLIKLDLSYNSIVTLPQGICKLKQLRTLNLSNNQLARLPEEFGNLFDLEKLDLSNNPITQLPLSVWTLKKLNSLNVNSTEHLRFPPPSIMSLGLSHVREYMEKVLKAEVPLKKRKIIVIGNESVGKTSFVQSLMKKGKKIKKVHNHNHQKKTDKSEQCILKINQIELQLKEKNVNHYSIFDFSGKVEYWKLVTSMFCSNAIYVLIWDMSVSINETLQELIYWLTAIKKVNGKTPSVLLVGSHADHKQVSSHAHELLKKVNSALMSKFQCIAGIFSLNCTNIRDQEIDLIKETLEEIDQAQGSNKQVPFKYLAFEELLLEKSLSSSTPLLDPKQIKILGDMLHLTNEDRLRALELLQSRTTVKVFPSDGGFLSSCVIVQPVWFVQLAIDLSTPNLMLLEKAPFLWIPLINLKNIWEHLPAELIPLLLRYFESLGICFVTTDQRVIVSKMLEKTNLPRESFRKMFREAPLQRVFTTSVPVQVLFADILAMLYSYSIISQNEPDRPDHRRVKHVRADIISLGFGEAEAMVRVVGPRTLHAFVTGPESLSLMRNLCDVVRRTVPMGATLSLGCPCPHCSGETIIELSQVIGASNEGKAWTVPCPRDRSHGVSVWELIPDMLFVDHADFRFEHSQLAMVREIAKGSLGTIEEATYKGDRIAVKQVVMDSPNIDAAMVFQEWYHEVQTMVPLHHQNLVKLLGITVSPFSLTMELLGQNLYDYLHQQQEPLPYRDVLALALDVTTAVQYLHGLHPAICHRDIKSPNIILVLGNTLSAKLADYGLAVPLYGSCLYERVVDQPTWLAPEILAASTYGPKADIYSLGVVFWELVARAHPFDEFASAKWPAQLEAEILGGLRPTMPEGVPVLFQNLIQQAWHPNPDLRPTAKEATSILFGINPEQAHQDTRDYPFDVSPEEFSLEGISFLSGATSSNTITTGASCASPTHQQVFYSPAKLVQRLTDPAFIDYHHSWEVLLLVTHGHLVAPDQFLELLRARTRGPGPDARLNQIRQWEKNANEIQMRVKSILKQWLQVAAPESQLQQEILFAMQDPSRSSPPSQVRRGESSLLRPSLEKLEMVDIMRSEFVTSDIVCLKFPASQIAHDLVVWQIKMIRAISVMDIISHNWVHHGQQAQSVPPLALFLEWFNQLKAWVITDILRQDTPKSRAKVIEAWVQIARALTEELADFNASTAILAALETEYIDHLNETWRIVPKRSLDLLEKSAETISPDNNFANYRQISKEFRKRSNPYVPYVALWLNDYIFCEEASPWINTEGEIDAAKIYKLGGLLKEWETIKALQPSLLEKNTHLSGSGALRAMLSVEIWGEKTISSFASALEGNQKKKSDIQDVSSLNWQQFMAIPGSVPAVTFQPDQIVVAALQSMHELYRVKSGEFVAYSEERGRVTLGKDAIFGDLEMVRQAPAMMTLKCRKKGELTAIPMKGLPKFFFQNHGVFRTFFTQQATIYAKRLLEDKTFFVPTQVLPQFEQELQQFFHMPAKAVLHSTPAVFHGNAGQVFVTSTTLLFYSVFFGQNVIVNLPLFSVLAFGVPQHSRTTLKVHTQDLTYWFSLPSLETTRKLFSVIDRAVQVFENVSERRRVSNEWAKDDSRGSSFIDQQGSFLFRELSAPHTNSGPTQAKEGPTSEALCPDVLFNKLSDTETGSLGATDHAKSSGSGNNRNSPASSRGSSTSPKPRDRSVSDSDTLSKNSLSDPENSVISTLEILQTSMSVKELGMTELDWKKLQPGSKVLSLQAGGTVLKHGEKSSRLFQVKSGHCLVQSKKGEQIGVLASGQVFGQILFLLGVSSPFSIVAGPSGAEVFVLESYFLNCHFANNSLLAAKFAFYLFESIADRYVHTSKKKNEKQK